MMRICSKCKINKPLLEFIKDNRRESGRGYRCLICHRLAENARIKTIKGKLSKKMADSTYAKLNASSISSKAKVRKVNRAAFINDHKASNCVDCGKNYPIQCMELDHVSGDKISNVSGMKSWNKDRISAEIKKCEIVCAVCHRIRTANGRVKSENKKILIFRKMIDEIKSVPCADCCQYFPSPAMDFDHIRDIKLFNISDMWHCSNEIIMEELNKCEIVCANCHRIRSQNSINRDVL